MHDETLPPPAAAARLADGVAVIRATRPAGEGFGRHTHDYHSVTVLLSSPGSSVWCYGDGKSRSVRPAAGDVFFCPANVPTAVRTEKAFESILLCLSPALFGRAADAAGGVNLGAVAPAVMRKDSFIQRVVTTLAEEVGRERRSGGELFAASLATALGVHLGREYAGPSGPRKPSARLSDDEMARLDRHITHHLDAPLTLDALASVVGRSRFHFARLFKASAGVTPHQYVVRRRVERARELLRAGGVIAEVAAAVGFASQSHLTLHVRRAFGCTPGQLVGPGS
ncbi:helix-turn-helix transcriptional regulator [bacterium]|nr:helix-turn-helix transcriptional regulator [bacterium]